MQQYRKMGVFIAATVVLVLAALWSGVVDRHWDLERLGPAAGNSVAVCAMLPAFAAITVRALTQPVFRRTEGAAGNVLPPAARRPDYRALLREPGAAGN